MPSNAGSRQALLTYLAQCYTSEQEIQILELGCGWGGLIQDLKKQFPSSRINAYENNLIPFIIAWVHTQYSAIRFSRSGIQVKFENFLTADWSRHDLVVAYLSPAIMQRIAEKLKQEQMPKHFISICFAIPGLSINEKCYANDYQRTPIFIYKLNSPGLAHDE